ncbi:hypothetical protein, partial [Gordonia alkanivorans]|uniref:hypothetical protein n=1 Tax=Gordonia alkanivorans TaxID=84096 RepID=UPI0024B9ED37
SSAPPRDAAESARVTILQAAVGALSAAPVPATILGLSRIAMLFPPSVQIDGSRVRCPGAYRRD